MRRNPFVVVLGGLALFALLAPACGGSSNGSGFGDGGNSSSGASSGGNSGGSNGSGGGSSSGCGLAGCEGGSGSSGGKDGGPPPCPAGLNCNPSCGGGTTSISGKVYDPAYGDPLYGIVVYVPQSPLQALPKGVPTGADACSCSALFKSGAYVSTVTGVDGTFKLDGVPVGAAVPLVMQVGKWRREKMITVTGCQDNPQPDKTLSLPGTLTGAGANDNMPDIAVSTGGADTLECLMSRIGIPAAEYVQGTSMAGHVHIFSGGSNGGAGGAPENPGWGGPPSPTALWATQADMMPYDITLLSCEGGETYNANPQVLEQYLNAGGRAFASHYHYAFFSPPTESGQAYMPPADWGNNLATWTPGTNGPGTVNGKVVQTQNVSGAPFAKGQALFQWLGLNGALGVLGAPPMEVNINPPRFNAVVGPTDKPSQDWVVDDSSPQSLFFSFDTPTAGIPNPDGGSPTFCGRAVWSGMHVSGNNPDPAGAGGPAACTMRALSPQEKVLEFMLFDLSACVIPDTETPPDSGPIFQ